MLPHDEAGAGPAVVLLHAGVADRRMWAEQLGPLADAGFRVVAMDLPGFGDAPLPQEPYAPWVDVVETMDALSIERAAVVGVSFGADVALRVALIAPERVTALVLLSARAPGVDPSEELRAAWEAENEAMDRGDVDGAVEAVVEAWTLPGAPAELRELVGAMQRRAFELDAEGGALEEAADPLEEDPDALRRLSVPTLAAAGERDKPDFREAAEVLAGTLPEARHAVIEGAGHLAPLETPETFRETVLGFLRRPS